MNKKSGYWNLIIFVVPFILAIIALFYFFIPIKQEEAPVVEQKATGSVLTVIPEAENASVYSTFTSEWIPVDIPPELQDKDNRDNVILEDIQNDRGFEVIDPVPPTLEVESGAIVEDISELKRQDDLLIDIRDNKVYEAEHIDGAINIPYEEIVGGALEDMPREQALRIYCQEWKKAGLAEEYLKNCWFEAVESLWWIGNIDATHVQTENMLK